MFKKYPEIENQYQKKFINRFFEKYPGLSVEHFIVTEKIDGANFSVVFHSNGDIQYYTRKGRLADDKFYGWKSAFQNQDIQNFLEALKEFCVRTKKTLQFVGELFGKGIQNRVYYGDKKYWNWFGIIDHTGESRILTFSQEEDLINECAYIVHDMLMYRTFYVPILYHNIDMTKFSNMEDMTNSIIIRRNSLLTPILEMDFREPNLIGGVVIRPKGRDYYSTVGSIFILKYKNDEFLENKIKVKRDVKEYSPELNSLLTVGLGFINENRSLSLFSKEGEIDGSSQIGEYIRLYAEDFFKDFLKDNNKAYTSLEKKEQKTFNKDINKEIVKELKRFL